MPQDYPTGGYITNGWYDITTSYSTTSSMSSNAVVITYDTSTTYYNNTYYPSTSTSTTSTIYYPASYPDYRPRVRPAPPEPTPEEVEALRQRWEARRQAREAAALERQEQEVVREAARVRAEELLHTLLTEEQRQELADHHYFHVVGGRTGRRYCIHRGFQGNIRNDIGQTFCAHAYENLPIADHMLSQKLALELDEDSFLAVANVS